MTEGRGDVLLVDDNADLREALKELLALEGFEVTAVGTGEECLDMLDGGWRPCVIVLDLVLPGAVDGREVRVRLAQHPGWAAIPIIVLSGVNKRPEVTAAELDLPPDHVILKPGDPDTLFALVARHCREKAA